MEGATSLFCTIDLEGNTSFHSFSWVSCGAGGKIITAELILLHLPDSIEFWESDMVEGWLVQQDFGRCVEGFALDAGGLAVDGDRLLVRLCTVDHLDHSA
jgi:hypothetical protein